MLAKVPCLLLATVGLHVSFTSPNPPASVENRPPVSSLADRIMRGMLTMRMIEYFKVRAKTIRLDGDYNLLLGLPLVLCSS